ncbi:MAG: GAF domain-containing protein [candidate division Zixibacteria bacterium]|nr:GAF domain-containing protein [candidate division Zixibacteria bacterium]
MVYDPQAQIKQLKYIIRELNAINQIATSIRFDMSNAEIADAVLTKAARHVEAEKGALILFDRTDRGPENVRSIEYPEEKRGWMNLELKAALLKKYRTEAQPLVINDLNFDPIFVGLSEPGVRMVIASPLQEGEQFLGILCLFDKLGGSFFSEADNRFAMIAATQAARFLSSSQQAEQKLRFGRELMGLRIEMMNYLLSETREYMHKPRFRIQSSTDMIEKALKVLLERLASEYGDDFEQKTEYKKSIESIRQELGDIQKNSQQLKSGLNQLDRLLLESSPGKDQVNINMIIRDVTNRLRQIISPRTEIETNLEKLPAFEADSEQIKLAFSGVLMNACDAVGESGRLVVSSSSADGELKIEISDDGRGIPEDMIKQIFEPGFSTKADQPGAGYGLTIARQIINNHRGKIQIKSQPGRGTVVTINLPSS